MKYSSSSAMRSSSSATSSNRLRPVTSNTSSATRLMMRAGVIIFVDAMPKAHQSAFAAFDALDEFGNVAFVADMREHLEHCFIRTAVQRTVERGCRARHRAVRIHAARTNRAHRIRAAILFVVGVQNEKDVERAFEHWVRRVLGLRHLEHHV